MTARGKSPLAAAIRDLVGKDRRIRPFSGGHTLYVERYLVAGSKPLGHEVARKTFQNLWVRTSDVDLRRLGDIEHRIYDHRTFRVSKPNHNLFAVPQFNGTDLICFRVTTAAQAARVIAEVAAS